MVPLLITVWQIDLLLLLGFTFSLHIRLKLPGLSLVALACWRMAKQHLQCLGFNLLLVRRWSFLFDNACVPRCYHRELLFHGNLSLAFSVFYLGVLRLIACGRPVPRKVSVLAF